MSETGECSTCGKRGEPFTQCLYCTDGRVGAAKAEPTKAELLACATRELRMRRRVYPHWVNDGRMPQAKADHELACMEAIVRLLEPLAEAEKPQGKLL